MATFGAEFKSAGYDGLMITGKAAGPTHVKSSTIASNFWMHAICGVKGLETEQCIRGERQPPNAVPSIGPAGENGVLFSSIQQEYFRSAARSGGGALWGKEAQGHFGRRKPTFQRCRTGVLLPVYTDIFNH